MSVTIEDIAKQLDLSVSTVSKALNGYSDVSRVTRDRILTAAQALGYHPNMAARSLRTQHTGKIGLVVNYPINIVDDFLSELIPGAAAAAEEADYNIILYTSVGQYPERLVKICRAKEVDGLLLLWPAQLDETIHLMKQERMPYIVLPRRVPQADVSYIAADHMASGQLLARHLIELGHRRIGFINCPELHETSRDRHHSYRQALIDASIPYDETLVIATDAQDSDNGKELLESFLNQEEPPTAILCFTDRIAMRILAAAHERGLAIPEELSIAGHDGILTSGMTVPALTTVRQPIPMIGRLAVESLLAHVADNTLSPSQHTLPVQLVVRDSTGPKR